MDKRINFGLSVCFSTFPDVKPVCLHKHNMFIKSDPIVRALFPAVPRLLPGLLQTRNSSTSTGDSHARNPVRSFSHQALSLKDVGLPTANVTSWFGDQIANASIASLSDVTVYRSKRMMLDTLGVGYLGSKTEITQSIIRWAMDCGLMDGDESIRSDRTGSMIWGSNGRKASPSMAAYINGISVHSMDFDDTWHPATHPSGPVLPTILALAETLTGTYKPSGEDLLVAYNVGIQVQGLLMRCSRQAREIPRRFHPPAVVGVMGSAAAASKLLGFGPKKSRHALAIAASFAGAPMANAGTKTKPLHCGKSARFGLEAAFMSDCGVEGNDDILDMKSGFGAFYDDYDTEAFIKTHTQRENYVLHDQDIAIKRFPAHLGMHWAVDAAMEVRRTIAGTNHKLDPRIIRNVVIMAPKSRYINRPLPASEHEARHSFQFMVCTALLDGQVKPESFHYDHLNRPLLQNLLEKTEVITPEDNIPSFDNMYVDVAVQLQDGSVVKAKCDTPYGHWRRPLSDKHVQEKFLENSKDMSRGLAEEIIRTVESLECNHEATDLNEMLAY